MIKAEKFLVLEKVARDILGPLTLSDDENRYILVIIGFGSKFRQAISLKVIDAPTIAKEFLN